MIARKLQAAVSASICAVILVLLSIHVGDQEGKERISLSGALNNIDESFIGDLEKGFAPHADTRPGHGGYFHNYFNVSIVSSILECNYHVNHPNFSCLQIFNFDLYDKNSSHKFDTNESFEYSDDTSPAENWNDDDVRDNLLRLLQGLLAVAAHQEQNYQSFSSRVNSVTNQLHEENISNSHTFDDFSTAIAEQNNNRYRQYSDLWSQFQRKMLNASSLLQSTNGQMKARIAAVRNREDRDYRLVLNRLDYAKNLTSNWYNSSVDHTDKQEKNLKEAVERFQASLESDMRSVENDDTQTEDRVETLLSDGARAMVAVKTAVGTELGAARAAAYELHKRTVKGLGPVRQSLSAVGSAEDEVATNIEGYRIYLEDELRPVEIDAAIVFNETHLRAAKSEQSLWRLLNATDATARDLETRCTGDPCAIPYNPLSLLPPPLSLRSSPARNGLEHIFHIFIFLLAKLMCGEWILLKGELQG